MNWKEALRKHWLNSIECLHIIHSDVSHCACGWESEIQPTVGEAVNRWVEHVETFVEKK
jgi:hypothetical protein